MNTFDVYEWRTILGIFKHRDWSHHKHYSTYKRHTVRKRGTFTSLNAKASFLGHILKKASDKLSTNLCVSARNLGALGTWHEEEPLQLHIPRRPSTALSACPSSTSTTILAASSTALGYSEHLKGGPEVLSQSVSGVVAGKEQRFDVQPRVTKSAYSRRRSLPRAIKQGNKGKGLRKTVTKALECKYFLRSIQHCKIRSQLVIPFFSFSIFFSSLFLFKAAVFSS